MKKYNFLIVDDSYLNRLLLRKFIKDLSDTIVEAENGLEAITAHHTQKIDIILMDIDMPIMNGIEAAIYIRTEMSYPKNSVPIIAVSACNPDHFENALSDDFVDAQFDKFLYTPVSKETLVEEVGTILFGPSKVSSTD